MNLTNKEINEIAKKGGIDFDSLMAFIQVETGGKAFGENGKLIIQFEPVWFRRFVPYTPTGAWSQNGVERQSQEWIAFNNAFSINPEGAMKATSIGLPQIMGFHFERLGYKQVGDMWDDFKSGEKAQVEALVRFINTDTVLFKGLYNQNFHVVASRYNGEKYRDQARRLGIMPYDQQMAAAFQKYKKIQV